MKVVAVTGSRHLKSKKLVWKALDYCKPDYLILGDCPTGADKFALLWAKANNVKYEVHKADWRTHGKAAGPVRNKAMANSASRQWLFGDERVVCLAFPIGESRGTRDCMKEMARHIGVKVVNMTEDLQIT